ncbi:aminoglycoside phosphotransferase family protein [Curtobacterium sp. Leaf261]|uniref:aminoglycoside phosphotransferase family protein n=1 Tax=Curtobacterium sp. Leaf261 TaxID=1736311 RepID=UPI0006FED0ED|nr:aminoglycoside phosphotransferase family protein [Curtobacterium sp. Leaf261]KQO62699.1 aminoglycoside phosphotransferase [Curtobacterium sp. Leaf261]
MDIDVDLARALVAEQFPAWADLPLREPDLQGWDNRTYRLGDTMSVRLPSAPWYVDQVQKERRWLPVLAPQLPLPIPEQLALGRPGSGYPFPWAVYAWRPGRPSSAPVIADLERFAVDLAGFLGALRSADTTDAPPAGEHNFHRGGSLSVYDDQARTALTALEGRIDTDTARRVWDAALGSTWTADPVWIHGDVATGNLLVDDAGALSAVIDFGGCAVGDPACDLVIAWQLFDDDARRVFREAVDLDADTWARARGWALWKAMVVATGVSGTVSPPPGRAWDILERVLAEHRTV